MECTGLAEGNQNQIAKEKGKEGKKERKISQARVCWTQEGRGKTSGEFSGS
jgi:hypothetical protein